MNADLINGSLENLYRQVVTSVPRELQPDQEPDIQTAAVALGCLEAFLRVSPQSARQIIEEGVSIMRRCLPSRGLTLDEGDMLHNAVAHFSTAAPRNPGTTEALAPFEEFLTAHTPTPVKIAVEPEAFVRHLGE